MRFKYVEKNFFPIMAEALFICCCLAAPKEYLIYLDFLFYALLALYFYIRKDFSLKEWMDALKSGKKFWVQVIRTILFFALSFALTSTLEKIFPDLDKGMLLLRAKSRLELFLFAASTIVLPPIVEETFYRKNLISFKSDRILISTTLLGMILYALEHALMPWGIFLCMIWALPLSISYIKTKNIYVPMTAHLICNLIINGITVVQLFVFVIE